MTSILIAVAWCCIGAAIGSIVWRKASKEKLAEIKRDMPWSLDVSEITVIAVAAVFWPALLLLKFMFYLKKKGKK